MHRPGLSSQGENSKEKCQLGEYSEGINWPKRHICNLTSHKVTKMQQCITSLWIKFSCPVLISNLKNAMFCQQMKSFKRDHIFSLTQPKYLLEHMGGRNVLKLFCQSAQRRPSKIISFKALLFSVPPALIYSAISFSIYEKNNM